MFLFLLISFVFSQEKDTTKIYNLEEVKVESQHINADENHLKKILNSTDDLLNRSSQITMLKRANFALEPTIRGLSNDRTFITIDGMHLFGACVDKMDPASNYIEIQNLESVEVSTPQNNCGDEGNNTINFKTEKANFSDNFLINYNSYYGSASNNFINGIKTKYSNNKFITSINLIYKDASDFRGGENKLIKNSGYGKYNLTNDNYLKINDKHTIGTSFLGDVSYDVGYPALIMDTRKTETFLFALKHNYIELNNNLYKSENKLYFNSVFHLMDDYDRSKKEIETRPVMPNMNMPMVGKTYTFGTINTYEIANEDYSIKFYNDLYSLFSDASMEMIPLNNNNIMKLKNIADANLINNKFTFSFNYFNFKNIQINSNIGLNFQYADLYDNQNKEVFLIFSEAKSSKHISFAPYIQTSVSKQYDNTKISISAAYFVRNPNRMELYSYYVYNPMDNSFYTGNPDIKNEKYFNLELNLTQNYGNFTHSLNLFNMEFYDYITGVLTDNQLQNENFPQLFKRYENTGRANIWGFEYISNFKLNKELFMDLTLKYNRAYSIGLKDNLPLISPFSGNLFLTYQLNKFRAVVDVSYNSSQNYISRIFLNENKTNSFVIAGIRADYQVADFLNLTFGVDNIFDTLYHYHTSINDLPSLGRNFYLKLNYNYK